MKIFLFFFLWTVITIAGSAQKTGSVGLAETQVFALGLTASGLTTNVRNSRSNYTIIHLTILEPVHEIMALFVLHKLILQTRMRSHPVGLDVAF